MRALVYHGPRNVSVDQVPDATIEKPTDALVRITTTNICGSDLHMYEGRTDVEQGKVVAVGGGVDRVRVGDMVCLPFSIGCGPTTARTAGPRSSCTRNGVLTEFNQALVNFFSRQGRGTHERPRRG